MKGRKRYGFIVDPGASSGLGGTDTIREYHESSIPYADTFEVNDSAGNFSGISGDAQPSLGMLTQKAEIGRMNVTWSGDMIGGLGSYCPMLLPLPPLVQHRGILLNGLTDDGDGALVMARGNDNSDIHVNRTLLTDSNHYLLPTDDGQNQRAEESKNGHARVRRLPTSH